MAKSLGSAYVLHHALGRGAMGQVFAGSVRDSGQPVAVKLLRPELVSDPDVVARFIQERTILMSIHDPNVVRVMDLVVEGETLAIVMELVQGTDLRRHLRERHTLPPAEALRLTAQVLRGVAAVHAAGIVHRDIKPENLLLDTSAAEPEVKLTDFGVARLTYGSSLTRLSGVIGTPEYMAPELAEQNHATAAADVYSVGIVLYEMLCGHTPFAGGHPLAVLRRHVEQDPPPIPGLPDGLWNSIARMLAKDPASRPADAGEAAAALVAPGTSDGTVLRLRNRNGSPGPGGRAPLAEPAKATRQARPPRRGRIQARTAVLAAGMAVVIAGAATAIALASTSKPAVLRPAAARQVAASSAAPVVTVRPATVRPRTAPSVVVVTQSAHAAVASTHPTDAQSAVFPPVAPSTGAMSSPPPTSPQPSATSASPTPAASLTDAEQQLAGLLNANIIGQCTARADLEGGIVLAAVNCIPVHVGPTRHPLAELIAAGDAGTWFARNTSGFTNNSHDCAAGQYLGNWSHKGVVDGQLGCTLESNGLLRIVWVVDNQVGLIAEGSDAQTLWSWWQSNACEVPAACT